MKWGKVLHNAEYKAVEGILSKVKAEEIHILDKLLLKELRTKMEPM